MQRIGFLCITVATVSCFGCGTGEDLPATAPVTGTVTYQGNPLPDAFLTFYPEDGQKPAAGTSDQSGAYTLTTFNNGDGAIPGPHTVTVNAYDATPEGASMRSLIPARYGDINSSPLKVTVEEGRNEIPLELTD